MKGRKNSPFDWMDWQVVRRSKRLLIHSIWRFERWQEEVVSKVDGEKSPVVVGLGEDEKRGVVSVRERPLILITSRWICYEGF